MPNVALLSESSSSDHEHLSKRGRRCDSVGRTRRILLVSDSSIVESDEFKSHMIPHVSQLPSLRGTLILGVVLLVWNYVSHNGNTTLASEASHVFASSRRYRGISSSTHVDYLIEEAFFLRELVEYVFGLVWQTPLSTAAFFFSFSLVKL